MYTFLRLNSIVIGIPSQVFLSTSSLAIMYMIGHAQSYFLRFAAFALYHYTVVYILDRSPRDRKSCLFH